MKKNGCPLAAAIVLAFLACLYSCSDILLTQMELLAKEKERPSVLPLAGTIIPGHEVFTLSFTRSMSGAVVTVGGDMASSDLAWSTVTYSDDQLVVSPKTAWSAGSSRSLRVTVTEGGETSVYDFAYSVFEGCCVSTSGSDTSAGTGTSRAPYLTIQKAITAANTLYGAGSEVHVATGTYSLTDATGGITLAGGVSVLGGYAADFRSRDWEGNVTTITDLRDPDDASTWAAITATYSGGVTSNATVFEGFTVQAAKTVTQSCTVAAIDLQTASPTIRNNTLHGGYTSNGICSAILIEADPGHSSEKCTPLIQGNTVYGEGAADVGAAYAIYAVSCEAYPSILDNTIIGGTASTTGGGCAAIMLSGLSDISIGTIVIERNIMTAGAGGQNDESGNAVVNILIVTTAIRMDNNLFIVSDMNQAHSGIYYIPSGAPSMGVYNNTFILGDSKSSLKICSAIVFDFSAGGSFAINNNIFYYGYGEYPIYALHCRNDSVPPNEVENNDFYAADGTTLFGYLKQDGTTTVAVADFVTIIDDALGNVTDAPALDAASDALAWDTATWRLTASSPASVATGGLDGSALAWGFTTDLAGTTRTGDGTTGWSMGCYEY